MGYKNTNSYNLRLCICKYYIIGWGVCGGEHTAREAAVIVDMFAPVDEGRIKNILESRRTRRALGGGGGGPTM